MHCVSSKESDVSVPDLNMNGSNWVIDRNLNMSDYKDCKEYELGIEGQFLLCSFCLFFIFPFNFLFLILIIPGKCRRSHGGR